MDGFPIGELDSRSEMPLYRQLYWQIKELIESGRIEPGGRLPATRELAGQLGLNRTTVSAAYELLESDGLITGHVGRGSFVRTLPASQTVDWNDLLRPAAAQLPASSAGLISFARSQPSEVLFPLDAFRETCREVIDGADAQTILQLGSPAGYGPLRRYLMEKARAEGVARASDDILITSGVQQAFDLLQRTLVAGGETVLLEDPVYPGVKNVFVRAGARLVGVPVGSNGLDLEALESAMAKERPRLLVVTSNFQNPTGATLPLAARESLLRIARRAGSIVVENDIYGPLAYEGPAAPTIKQLDDTGDTIQLRSFSKLAFPGLRVGWAIGPRALIERLTEAKQLSDLHADQLSQAVLLRFAESGRLKEHRGRMLAAGLERLRAALRACGQYLPQGSQFTRPSGGMNLWVRLPEPIDTGEMLPRVEREGVTYLPGKYFAVSRVESRALRLCFAGLTPDQIAAGIAILGSVFGSELERIRAHAPFSEVPALV